MRIEIDQDMKRVCAEAAATWGSNAQMIQAMAECGELISAIGHHFQNRPTATAEVAGEVADVYVLMTQLRLMLGEEYIEECIERSLAKLQKKINEHQNNDARRTRAEM